METKEQVLKKLGWSDKLIRALVKENYNIKEIEEILVKENESTVEVISPDLIMPHLPMNASTQF